MRVNRPSRKRWFLLSDWSALGASRSFWRRQKLSVKFFGLSLALAALLPWQFPAQPAQAATGINTQINFQARLQNAQGAIVPDGTYNMQFKIYQDGDGCMPGGSSSSPCGGTLKWTEDWVYGSGSPDHRVTVKNGYFSVLLGSVNTALGTAVDFNQDNLWLSLNIGNTSTAASFAGASGDGEMTPFKRFAANPYAINSGKLGGLTSGQFVQLAQGLQADSSTTSASIAINKTGSTANILQLQRGGVDVLVVNNSGNLAINGQIATFDQTAASTNSADLVIRSGNASGSTSSSGNVTIDAGIATGTSGSVTVAGVNASGLALGRSGLQVVVPGSLAIQGANSLTVGTSSNQGSIVFKDGTANGLTNTLDTTTLSTGSKVIHLPNEDGTVCLQSSSNCGFALTSGSGNYVQFAPGSAQADSTTNSSIFINKTGSTGNVLQLQKSGSDKFVVSNSGNVGIGITTPVSKLDVVGSAGVTASATSVLTGSIDPTASAAVAGVGTLFSTELVVGDRITVSGETRTVVAITSNTALTVDSAFSNNANDTSVDRLPASLTVRASNNTTQFVINDQGFVGVGTANPIAPLSVVQGYNAAVAATQFGQFINTTYNVADTGQKYGLYTLTQANHSSGTIAQLIGNHFVSQATSGGGTTTEIINSLSRIDVASGHTVGTAYNLYVADNAGAGSAATQYGLYVNSLANAASNYAVYTAGSTSSYFGGNLGVGTSPVTYKLQVAGDINVSSGSTYRINGASINTGGALNNVAYKDSANRFTNAAGLQWTNGGPMGGTPIVVRTNSDGATIGDGVWNVQHAGNEGFILHMTTVGTGGAAVGIGVSGTGTSGLIVDNYEGGQGIILQNIASINSANSVGFYGLQYSSLAPLMQFNQGVTNAAVLSRWIGTNSGTGRLTEWLWNGGTNEAGYVSAADGSLNWTSPVNATGNLTAGTFIEKTVTFTPTTAGWYRILTNSAFTAGGTVRITAPTYDNSLTDVELQYSIGGFGTGGSIQQTRFSSFNNGVVSQARISSDGLNSVYLDIYISTATTPQPVTVYGYGPKQSVFVASPVVGAVAGSTDVNVLTLGHGFRTTQGANFAETGGRVGIGTTGPAAKLDILNTGTSPYVTTGMRLQSTFTPTAGGTQTNFTSTVTNTPTSVSNTIVEHSLTINDSTALANTLQGINLSINDTGSAAKTIRGLLIDTSGTTNASASITNALFKGTTTTNLVVQNGTGTELLRADTSAMVLKLGTTASVSLSGAKLLVTSTEVQTALRIGDGTNGIDFAAGTAPSSSNPFFKGTSRPTKKVSLVPEYPGGVMTGDGTNNIGTMTSDFCSGTSRLGINTSICAATDEHNFYSWTSQATNDYDIYIRYQLPSDFDGFASNSTIQMYAWRTASTEKAELAVFNAAGAQCGSTTEINSSNTTWQQTALTGSETTDAACTTANMAPGSTIEFRIKLTVGTNNNFARAGEISFDYLSKF